MRNTVFLGIALIASVMFSAPASFADAREDARQEQFQKIRAAFGYDDLNALIKAYGKPDLDESSTNSPIAMRIVTYRNESLKIMAYAEQETKKWQIMGFLDSASDKDVSVADAKNRLSNRLSERN